MDEKDKPRDAYHVPDLQEDLQAQLSAALERSKNPQVEADWTPEEQAKLQAELARIEFKPEYANPDYPDRTVQIGGEEIAVHGYNNFTMILSIVDRLNHHRGALQFNTIEQAYASEAGPRRYPEIFDRLEHRFPALYKRSRQIYASGGKLLDHRGKQVGEDEAIFIQSQAYLAAAELARHLDPNYNLAFLR